jgi:hypothetical protein
MEIQTETLVLDDTVSLPTAMARLIETDCEVWEIEPDSFGRTGHIVVWPRAGRAGVHFDNEILWGAWDAARHVIRLDDDEFLEVTEDGRIVDTRRMA